MPDVQEVFRMATQKVRPDPGALERQLENQDRRRFHQKAAAYVAVAAIAIALVMFVLLQRSEPRETAVPTQPRGFQPAIVGLDGSVQDLGVDLPDDAWGLTLSPDGSTVAFVTWEPFGFCGACSPGPRIAAVGVDGSDPRFLTLHNGDRLSRYVGQPAWSPDGTQVAFVGGRGVEAEIFVVGDGMDPAVAEGGPGSAPKRLTRNRTEDANPRWSPDGQTIVYDNSGSTPLDGSLLSPTQEIWSIPAAGGTPTRLTNNSVPDSAPSYSPDGRILMSHNNGFSTMPPTGGPMTLILSKGGYAPRWSPDGTNIAFLVYRDHREAVDDFFAGGEGTVDLPMLSVDVLDVATGEVTTLPVEVATALNAVSWLPSGDAIMVNRFSE